jgi:hypothetical protein
MITLIIAAIVSIIGGIGTYLFRATIGSWIFSKPDPAQAAVNQQKAMDDAAMNPPSQAQAVKDLKDGRG